MPNNFYTVPNQKTIVVHRTKCDRDFLQIKKSTLFEAYNTLGHTALVLYLYLVGNRDNYTFAFSPSAIQKETGIPESTCRDQIKKLIACKYLVPRSEGSNIYDFYERPHFECEEDHQVSNVEKTTSPTNSGEVTATVVVSESTPVPNWEKLPVSQRAAAKEGFFF